MLMLKKEMQMLCCQLWFLESENSRNDFCKAHWKLTQFILVVENSFVGHKGLRMAWLWAAYQGINQEWLHWSQWIGCELHRGKFKKIHVNYMWARFWSLLYLWKSGVTPLSSVELLWIYTNVMKSRNWASLTQWICPLYLPVSLLSDFLCPENPKM